MQSAADTAASKEVVQLKFLQKSNEEQMDKLFALIRYEPLVIHHYLQKTIFPLHMRSQHMKISASGQAVGGDMLVGKRVGFSGTPSDLLPHELGRCDYETGDDGMMLTTVLDRGVASYEFMQVRCYPFVSCPQEVHCLISLNLRKPAVVIRTTGVFPNC